jgi:hypothetical protein
VVNNRKCEFVYFVKAQVKCFAITKRYLLRNIFLKYPEIGKEIKISSQKRYNKEIKNPISF